LTQLEYLHTSVVDNIVALVIFLLVFRTGCAVRDEVSQHFQRGGEAVAGGSRLGGITVDGDGIYCNHCFGGDEEGDSR